MLVETKIKVARQSQLGGVNYLLEGIKVVDWPDDPKSYRTPNTPYTIWMQDGSKNLKVSVEKVRENLAADERGATGYDGIALYIANSEILKDHFIDLPGTQVESDLAPCLSLFNGGPRLDDDWVGRTGPYFGSASCGRE